LGPVYEWGLSAQPEVEHLFVGNFGTEIIGAALRNAKLFSLNEILDNEEAPLVSSSVAQD
jgi:hypothetical protein